MALRSISFADFLTQSITDRLRKRSGHARTLRSGVCFAAIALSLSVSLTKAATAQTQTQTAAETPPTQTAQVTSTEIIEPPTAPAPKPTPFSPSVTGIVNLSESNDEAVMSIGHLRPQDVDSLSEDNVSWLSSVILPLYVSPGGDHWGWIYQGWLVPDGQAYLAIGRDAGFAMVKPYENLYTFPVLENREDGWLRVQYTPGGSAWVHASQLALGDTPLVFESWAERLEAQASVYFLDTMVAQALRSRPEPANNLLSLVAADSLIEPLDFAGDWMRVRVTRPTAACEPLTGATVTEGWMRWRSEEQESLVWYRPDGSCQQS